ncbi:oxidoreductase-like protein [Immersiella caudata]|uniref:Oxidoreductase-like protein n=1 Tax=Immersiella caudata TaxID=314043 RepID=A0AA39XDR2_9PEZI|nr:oxidoreductase-like protein [Immersiella caudata]
MAIDIIDPYYLTITLLFTVAYQLLFFSIAFTLKFDKLTDFAGGTNFALLSILTLSLSSPIHTPTARQLVASLFLIVWSLRLSSFLLFRVLKTGKDDRFDDKRDHFFRFLGFWVFQMIWVWVCSMPVTVLNSPAVQERFAQQGAFGSGLDIAGCVLFGVGFVMESVSDVQRYLFRKRVDSRTAVCDGGFFYVSRHPNYFGEIAAQLGIYLIAISPAANGYVTGSARSALYGTVVSPVLITMLLMFLSGLPLSERPGAKKRYEAGTNWEAYERYLKRTSILIPFPPQLYERVPVFLKRTIFLEFPMYVFDPAKHSEVNKQRSAEEGGAGENRESGDGLVAGGQTRQHQG